MKNIRLVGFALGRRVIMNNKPVDLALSLRVEKHSLTGFNWGYVGESSYQLALAILLQCKVGNKRLASKSIIRGIYKKFAKDIISLIPQENFDVEIDLKQWIEDAISKTSKPAQIYMNVNIGSLDKPVWISKFIDFGYSKFATGVFNSDTHEYYEFKKLSLSDDLVYRKYLRSKTQRKSPKDDKIVYSEYYLDDSQDVYFVGKGMGSGYNYGTRKNIF